MTIKAATISVEGFVLFCDGKECKVRGGQGLDVEDILEGISGWEMNGDDGDLCQRCSARRDEKLTKPALLRWCDSEPVEFSPMSEKDE